MPRIRRLLAALVAAVCIVAAPVAGRKLHQGGTTAYPAPDDSYAADTGEQYAAEPSAPPPAEPEYDYYEPQVYQLEWAWPSDWDPPGDKYPEQSAWYGDAANFTWTGNHGVWLIPNGTCPEAWDPEADGFQAIAAPTVNSYATVQWDAPGTYWYACPVPGHCKAGMIVKYVVKPWEYKGKAYELVWNYPSDLVPPLDAYPNQTAWVNDRVNFTWAGNKGVWRIPSGECPTAYDSTVDGYEEVAAAKPDGYAVYEFSEPGVYWFASPVSGHCEAGLKVKYEVKYYKPPPYKYADGYHYVDWKSGWEYPEGKAKAGDSLKWSWKGNHGVWRVPGPDCPETWDETVDGYEAIAPASNGGSAEYKFAAPGTYWFASPAPGDCEDGMLAKWVVTA